MSFECIIFDLDGTLTEPEEGITRSIEYALNKMGIKVDDRKALTKYIGPPLLPVFQEDYGMTEKEAWQALEFYRERFLDKGMYENRVYDGIEELLSRLKENGKKIMLATTKPYPQAVGILEHFGLMKYFDVVSGADMSENLVEKPDVMRLAISKCPQANQTNTVMVGDRKYDILGAKAHKIPSIGVLYGYGDYEELSNVGATYFAKNVEELAKLLL